MVPAKVKDLLARIECTDLYEFLGLDRDATLSQLQAAAQKEFDSIQNKGKRGGIWDYRKELTGLCKTVFRNAQSKRDYDRTLTEAEAGGEPEGRAGGQRTYDESAVLLESGRNFVRRGRVEEAAAVARRLRGDDYEYTGFRLTVAEILMAREPAIEAVEFLLWCENEEPANQTYKAMLGVAFAKGGIATWQRVDGNTYATSAEHVAEAEACLTRAREYAEGLTGRDDGLQRAIAALEAHVATAKRPKWNGNVLAAIGGGLYGFWLRGMGDLAGSAGGGSELALMGTVELAATAAYVVASREPQWRVNRQALSGPHVGGALWYLMKAVFTVGLMPLVAAWKFFTIWWPSYRLHPWVQSPRRGWTEVVDGAVGLMGRGPFLIVLVGGLALVGAGTGLLFRVNGTTSPMSDAAIGGAAATNAPPTGSAPGSTTAELAAGERGFDRAARLGIQEGLRAAGFYAGAVDGLIGPRTRGAIRNWQTAQGLEATGYLDEAQGAELMALAPVGDVAPPRGSEDFRQPPAGAGGNDGRVVPAGAAGERERVLLTGTVREGGRVYAVEIVLEGQGGSVRYPSLGCEGDLQPIELTEQRLEYLENLDPPGACSNAGRVVLERTTDNSFDYSWYGGGARPSATGILRRWDDER